MNPLGGAYILSVNIYNDTITIIHGGDFSTVRKIILPKGSGPVAVTDIWDDNFIDIVLEFKDMVMRYDITNDIITKKLYCGGAPADIKVGLQGRYGFINSTETNSVCVLDRESFQLKCQYSPGKLPLAMAVDPIMQMLIIVFANCRCAVGIDMESQLVNTILGIPSEPAGTFYSIDGSRLYIYSYDYDSESGLIHVLDPVDYNETDIIKIKTPPFEMVEYGDYLCHTSPLTGSVEIVNMKNHDSRVISTGQMPAGILIHENNLIVSDAMDLTISVVNIYNAEIINKHNAEGGGWRLYNIDWSDWIN